MKKLLCLFLLTASVNLQAQGLQLDAHQEKRSNAYGPNSQSNYQDNYYSQPNTYNNGNNTIQSTFNSQNNMGSSGVVQVNANNYDQTLAASYVILDVYATWCGPCKNFANVFSNTQSQWSNQIVFAKLDIDQAKQIAGRLNVSSLPTIIFFKNGQEVGRQVGAINQTQLNAAIQQHFNLSH